MTTASELPRWSRRWSGRRLRQSLATLLMVACGLGVWPEMGSGADEGAGRTPPRLSLLDGEVSFWRPGADDWAAARINLALAPGDYLYTGVDGRLELQVSGQGFVRAGAETELSLEEQEVGSTLFNVTGGEVSFDLRAAADGETFVFAAPNASFRVEEPGYYRIIVTGDTTRFAVRQGGRATVRPVGGASSALASGEEVEVDGTTGGHIAVSTAPPTDEWDRWNYERTAEVSSSESARYVPSGVYGVDTLDRYGRWQQEARYGWVWVPRAVPVGWAPYSAGRWIWDGYYGWTWIDDTPWGWAPYHYGRWVYAGSYWAWAPGPVLYPPVYAPALVAFFGGGGFLGGGGFGVSVGVPFVSWVALGWGEPLIPWWGPRGFYGRPCWAGWGGPHVVNNVYINKTKIVNVHDVHHYQNTRVRDGVIAVRRDQFARSAVARSRITHVNVRDLKPLAGRPPVESGPRGLVEAAGRGRRPPATLHDRALTQRNVPRGAAATADARQSGPSGSPLHPRETAPEQSVGTHRLPPPLPGERSVERGSARHTLQGTRGDDAQRLRASRNQPGEPTVTGSGRRPQPPPLPGSANVERRWRSALDRPERNAAVTRGSSEPASRPSMADRIERGTQPRIGTRTEAPRRPDAAAPSRDAAREMPPTTRDVRSIPSRPLDARRTVHPEAARFERPEAVPPSRMDSQTVGRSAPTQPRWERAAPQPFDIRRVQPGLRSAPLRFGSDGGVGGSQADAPSARPSGAMLREMSRSPVMQQPRHSPVGRMR